MTIKTGQELAAAAKNVAENYKTLYVMGCFGAPLKKEYKERYCTNYDYNKQPERTAMIMAASEDTFGFDCVCLIKGLLWGWNGDKNKVYGGAAYASNGVPDLDCDVMFNKCSEKSSDFSKIAVGEAVWMNGHIGVYIGNGLAVECTPKWKNNVQITAVGNIGAKKGYDTRTWTKHGKLPYVKYDSASESVAPAKPAPAGKTIDELANEVIAGKWGNGNERKKRLTEAGYDYNKVQARVDEILSSSKKPTATAAKSIDELAREVIAGKWGNGNERKKRLTDAGYDYNKVQARVNELVK